MLGVTLRWTRIPSIDLSRCYMLQKPEISAGLMSHLARMQALPIKTNVIGLQTPDLEILKAKYSVIICNCCAES